MQEELAKESRNQKKEKKKKVGKKEKDEYATIEVDIEALEAEVAKAEAELEEGNNAKPRLGQMELLALVMAASEARKALDDKMERYLELEELMAD